MMRRGRPEPSRPPEEGEHGSTYSEALEDTIELRDEGGMSRAEFKSGDRVLYVPGNGTERYEGIVTEVIPVMVQWEGQPATDSGLASQVAFTVIVDGVESHGMIVAADEHLSKVESSD